MRWAFGTATDTQAGGCRGGGNPPGVPIDPNGNLLSKVDGADNWAYTWNAENQLSKVEKNGSEVARFAYDALGRRVEKAAGGVTTTYAYDGAGILREIRGSTAMEFVQGLAIDEVLAVDDGTLGYFHQDALGSVLKMTNVAGVVTLTRQYDAWGNLEEGAGSPAFAFTGREWDSETGLHYYRARYYDAGPGRFASEDPIKWLGGVNLYSYVSDAPTNRVDPLGLAPQERLCRCLSGSEGPRPSAHGGVCCQNGTYVLCYKADFYRGLSSRGRGCLRLHEQTHADDYKWVGKPCDLADPCQVMSDKGWRVWESECRAYLKEMACLSGSLNLSDTLQYMNAGMQKDEFCTLVRLYRQSLR